MVQSSKNGFEPPNYTKCPNELLGNKGTPGMMADMHESELKVTLAIVRMSFGYHRDQVRLSLTNLQDMTGLSRQGVLDGAKAAEERGIIRRYQDGGVTLWEAVVNEFDQNGGQQSRPGNGEDSQQSRPPSRKEKILKEKEHGADAPSEPGDSQTVLVDGLEFKKPKPSNPPKDADELRERTLQTEKRMLERIRGEPWSSWGVESDTFSGQLERYGENGRRVQHIGYILDKRFGLRPIWQDKKKVKSWSAGLAECLEEAEGKVERVTEAASRLRDSGMTISDPWSLVKTVRAVVAEARSGTSGSRIVIKV